MYLHAGLIKWPSFMNCIINALQARSEFDSCRTFCLLKRNRPASLKLAKTWTAKPQHWHESTCTDALFHMCLHSIQTYPEGVAGVSWHFPRGPAVYHRKCVICANTHMQIYSLSIIAYVHVLNLQSFEVTKPGGLATNCSRRNRRWGGPGWFSRKTRSSYRHLANDGSWTNTSTVICRGETVHLKNGL